MATKIPIGTSAYFTSFVDGQGVGASDYFTYAEDEDTNWLLLRATINQLIDEISALSGPNAIAALDAFLWDDEFNPITAPEQKYGVVGAASYEVSIEGGGTTLECRKGQVYINGQRASLVSDVTGIAGFGGAGTLYVAVDVNGVPSIHDLPAQKALDIASVTWNGAAFTGSVTHLADVFFDGDSWAYLRDRPVTPDVATFGARVFREGAYRIRALELFLAGQDTGAEGEAIAGPLVLLPGAVGAPSIILGDGSTTFDTTTGWYRSGANTWAYAGSGALLLSLATNGLVFAQLGSAGAPILRHTSGAGIYFLDSGNEVAVGCAADLAMRWKSPTNKPQALVADGDVTDPGLGFDQEENTGWYRPGAAQLAAALAGVQKLLLTANQLEAPDGIVSAPGFAFLAEPGTGFYRSGAGEIAVALGGAKRFHFILDQMHAPNGAVGTPAYGFDNDLDTGMYLPGVGRLGFATAGNKAAEIDAVGNLDLPLNFGAIVRRVAGQAGIVSGTPTSISWDTEDEDRGGWITVTSPSLTCPTDGDGLYLVTLAVEWPTNASPAGYRDVWLEVGGTIYGLDRYDQWVGAQIHYQTTSAIIRLVATDILLGRIEHLQGAGQTLTGARLVVQKIA